MLPANKTAWMALRAEWTCALILCYCMLSRNATATEWHPAPASSAHVALRPAQVAPAKPPPEGRTPPAVQVVCVEPNLVSFATLIQMRENFFDGKHPEATW